MMRALLVAAVALLPLVGALPTPGLNGPAAEPVQGRIFPEALRTNDYVSYDEAVAGLKLLEERHPERIQFVEIGQSVGWTNLAGGAREPKPMFAVEVTNEESAVPFDQKLKSVFFLSIHGNEKGGREGGLRAIEDLVAGKGIALEEPDVVELLDFQVLAFVFANVDGWTHEELAYRANDACYTSATCAYGTPTNAGKPGAETQNFVRVNGNGIDLNRQFPTVGYLAEGSSWQTLSQPESQAMAAYTKGLTRVVAGADIHGMINHDHYFLMMLKDGQRTQEELFANERLAESLKERINGNSYYAAWAASPHVTGAWGGEGLFAEWMTTIDSIGYSASGTAGAWIVQEVGLDAPGFTVEMAYNHIAVDNYYPGAGAVFNDYHVRAVRDTVLAFLRFGAEQPMLSLDTQGQRLAWLPTDAVATSRDDDKSAYQGWFVDHAGDDAFDILHVEFEASPNEWFTDLRYVLRDGEAPGVLDELRSAQELTDSLSRYQTVVIPGSAAAKVVGNAAAVGALQAWVRGGGTLVLTDEALRLLAPLGLVEAASIDSVFAYSGYTDLLDRNHPLAGGLRGAPRQTYDPNPLGFGDIQSPVWFVQADAFQAAGGEAVGTVDAVGDGAPSATGNAQVAPQYANVGVNLGRIPMGEGEVRIFGAILPDPTEENLHPYGLSGHSVSAAGNVLLLNLLGLAPLYEAPPLIIEDLARIDPTDDTRHVIAERAAEAGGDAPLRIPLPVLLAAGAAAAAGLLRRRG